ncbi:hypothetical protein CHLRE_02g081450v5 [Chlamydomonas reinhardtii]|uniref:Large ribosomal subunit protein bL25 beta domain-containing protein n=1 Tax=Chlamydomonas reinhardtii TaxID=3055 RepID=A0A2K3E0K7_CHLRE|nr:uncharacterized protein CHLRE_02g081450v5 [Chlamydomonas reinhardtii]PNW86313.1 hypothetical protein CHLRE_02g081450v5 [Chlamydomonas reinhardtii]7PKT_t Chain t, Ribosomal_TL5_C domain-containing protein [Chlamydomonas reinhardtii]
MRCATGATASLLPAARSWAVSMLTSGLDHGLGVSVLGGGPLPGLLARARHDSALAQRASEQVVPPEILRELQQLEGSLNDAARLDGRRRSSLRLSQSTLPLPLPTHTVEPGLPALDAHVRPRSATGGTACKWLRRAGRVPGRVHSLPGADARAGAAAGHSEDQGASSSSSNINNNNNKLLVHFSEGDVAKLIRTFGRNGCTARVLQLNLVAPDAAASDSGAEQAAQADAGRSGEGTSGSTSGTQLGMLRVKPTRVFVNAVTQRVEGLDLIYCPPERQVLVDVPVRLLNDDLAPGVKKGGWIALFKRTVRYKALGGAIPPYIEVNVRNMDLDQDMLVRDMPIPPGTKLYEKDYNAPVLRCTTDVGKD